MPPKPREKCPTGASHKTYDYQGVCCCGHSCCWNKLTENCVLDSPLTLSTCGIDQLVPEPESGWHYKWMFDTQYRWDDDNKKYDDKFWVYQYQPSNENVITRK